MYDLEATITTIFPGRTPCLACLCPEPPKVWQREFPVFGAVAGTVACIAAMEAIKVIAGFGSTLDGRMLAFDLRQMTFSKRTIRRRHDCAVCSRLW
jgi:bacteriocin biosynthesis cyclodehydratase domain-containing protein